MQVAFTPSTPAEVRLLATFMQDYADHLEIQEPVKAEEPPKRKRAVKEDATPPANAADETPPPKKGKALTLDGLRSLFAELDAAGKRAEAVSVVTGAGFKAIKDIPEDKMAEIAEAWSKL